MTVKQLKKELEKYPDNMEVVLPQLKTDFGYGELNSVKKKKIGFREEPDSKDLASAVCCFRRRILIYENSKRICNVALQRNRK